ncbi:MAG: SDR family oxidoreductase, partial [Promethearchaeota archaeon]
NKDSAQTSLHCLLSDDAPKHSGAYFSQSCGLYRDKERRDGGWPMTSPNPNARNIDTAKKLVDLSYKIVGLEKD